MKFLSPEVTLYLHKPTAQPYMEYCCHVWTGSPVTTSNCCISYKNGYDGLLILHLLPLLNPWLITEMQPASFFSTGNTLVDAHLNWLNWFHFLILEGGLLVILIDCMIFLSPFLDVKRTSMSIVSFLTQLDFGILYL